MHPAKPIKARGRERSPWLAKIYELTSDGQWHDRDSLEVQASTCVPTGIAVRHIEKARQRVSGEGTVRKRPHGAGDLTLAGQMVLAREAVRGLLRTGRLEAKEEDGKTLVRMATAPLLIPEAAKLIGKAATTFHSWTRNPQIVSEVEELTPPGVPPVVHQPGGWKSIPRAALPAWRKFGETRKSPTKFDRETAAQIIADAFDMEVTTVLERLDALRRNLAIKGFCLRQDVNIVPRVRQRQPNQEQSVPESRFTDDIVQHAEKLVARFEDYEPPSSQ